MIGRFLTLAVLMIVGAGLVLHFNVDVPSWIGHLPGDLIMKKGGATIYFPFTTALLFSAGLTLFGFLIAGKS
jgi:hypothetical protein